MMVLMHNGLMVMSKYSCLLRSFNVLYLLFDEGLTETCAGTFLSIPNEMSMLGTVGPPLPNVDVCLESVPEMGYDALSETPRGEICIRGDTLFVDYYKREEEVFVDGWFHTTQVGVSFQIGIMRNSSHEFLTIYRCLDLPGDVGEWQPNGSLRIIDRKKNIFKLSQGEYVAVEHLENIFGSVPDIEMVIFCISLFSTYFKTELPINIYRIKIQDR